MSARKLKLGPEHGGERIDKVLPRLLGDVSRATVQRWIEEGRVRLDGKPCRARDSARPGSEIEVEPGPAPMSQAEPDGTIELEVRYEDAHLLVVNKPAGLVVHPARGHRHGTLVNGLLARSGFTAPRPDARDESSALRPGIVHRIDKDTSGLLVVAKDESTREGLKTQLAAHTVERAYLALCLGVPRGQRIRSFYGRDPRSRLRFSSLGQEGRLAITHVRVVETLAASRAALVECRLETGRTHQIRVHLSQQAKTPIFADPLYGRPPAAADLAKVASTLGRQALHAAVLGFVHPMTKETLRFEEPPPSDFSRALAQLRALSAP